MVSSVLVERDQPFPGEHTACSFWLTSSRPEFESLAPTDAAWGERGLRPETAQKRRAAGPGPGHKGRRAASSTGKRRGGAERELWRLGGMQRTCSTPNQALRR